MMRKISHQNWWILGIDLKLKIWSTLDPTIKYPSRSPLCKSISCEGTTKIYIVFKKKIKCDSNSETRKEEEQLAWLNRRRWRRIHKFSFLFVILLFVLCSVRLVTKGLGKRRLKRFWCLWVKWLMRMEIWMEEDEGVGCECVRNVITFIVLV